MKRKHLLTVALLFTCSASANDLSINQIAPYHDAKVIQDNVKQECIDLGKQFSDATISAVKKNGWSVSTRPEAEPSQQGLDLKLTIVNAISSGGFYIGQRKSVSIEAVLYKDGQVVNTFNSTRNSGGGAGGSFKSSCSILKRCVDTLGVDVSKWLKTQKI